LVFGNSAVYIVLKRRLALKSYAFAYSRLEKNPVNFIAVFDW